MVRVSRRRQAVIASAPMIPTAADSVAVAMPKKMAPMTIISRTSGGSRSGNVRIRASQLVKIFSPPQSGRQRHAISTVKLKSSVRMKPGMNPARYSFGTEVSVITP